MVDGDANANLQQNFEQTRAKMITGRERTKWMMVGGGVSNGMGVRRAFCGNIRRWDGVR